ncbi:MAG: nitroreductase family protein [Clostridia bacterium]|nr:nitroreductase family protein [Clostridia bacterium]
MKEIFERRSIRKYTADPVSLEHEEKLLRAAMQAPSAGNEQPWEFIVVRDPETLKKMTEGHPYSTPLLGAPLGILVCGDVNKQKFNPYAYWVQDCSAAIQNLLLEAQHLGLGAVWMGLHPIKEREDVLIKLFELPEGIIPLGMIAVGHPAQTVSPVDRYLPERVHREKW